jgi:hypothetical protein
VESGAFQPGGVSLIKKRDPKAVVRKGGAHTPHRVNTMMKLIH